ncbi:peroxidase-like [Culicoides brevitarsis]|uniref:peroxidase-like n=1 Tax=Culicoides brevitarsis TaxID=469753 RepID=UPI00307C21C0
MFTKFYTILIALVSILTNNECHSSFFHAHQSTLPPFPNVLRALSQNDLTKAADMGMSLIDKEKRLEDHIRHSPARVSHGSISHGLLLESLPTNASIKENYVGDMILKATNYLMNSKCKNHGISSRTCAAFVSQYEIPEESPLRELCEKEAETKDNGIYRRLLPNNYKDGIYQFPVSEHNHQPLPDARYIAEQLFVASNTVNQRTANTEGPLDQMRTIAVAQWAQFIEQDLARTVQRTMYDGTTIECCNKMHRKFAPRSFHPACHPLKIRDEDIFYKKIGVSCLNYVRSAIAVNPTCKFGAAEQLNQATNRLDLSQVYGVDAEALQKLRKFHGGKLHTHDDQTLSYLPFANAEQISKYCRSNETNSCYISGDPRVNSNPYSMALHTIFLRSHNKIASELTKRHPQWTDEELFYMSRVLNTILYQKIIYEEWAPIVLGREAAERILLTAVTTETDQVSNEFATVGIRFYNTMFPGDLILSEEMSNDVNERGDNEDTELFKLQDVQYKKETKKHTIDKIMSAVTRQHAMRLDTSYVDDLSNQLFRTIHSEGEAFGSDSLALDIQRSRDHGLQSYIKYVNHCKDLEITSWEDLEAVMETKDINILRNIYASYHDIDLIVGALSEKAVPGATVGPTMQCLIEDQLTNARLHDPYFYKKIMKETGVQKTASHSTSTKLLCGTTLMAKVQQNVFLVPSRQGNPLVDCAKVDYFLSNSIRLRQ